MSLSCCGSSDILLNLIVCMLCKLTNLKVFIHFGKLSCISNFIWCIHYLWKLLQTEIYLCPNVHKLHASYPSMLYYPCMQCTVRWICVVTIYNYNIIMLISFFCIPVSFIQLYWTEVQTVKWLSALRNLKLKKNS